MIPHVFRRLSKGQAVQLDQIVALLNPAKARTDLAGKEAKVNAARAKHQAAAETTGVAKYAYDLAFKLWLNKTVSEFELKTSYLQWLKSQQDEVQYKEEMVLAQSDVAMSKIILSQHVVRSQVKNGIVKEIRKDLGEAVKPGDTIMELHSLDSFIAEGRSRYNTIRCLHAGHAGDHRADAGRIAGQGLAAPPRPGEQRGVHV